MAISKKRLLDGLNPQQREAVETTDGPVLVLAGAGSGKTRVITTRIAYLLGTGLAKPEQVLALTFTNKAAGEMRERVAGLVGRKKAANVTCSTFHSFCVRVLREEIERLGYRKNFTISSDGDVRTLVQRTLDDISDVKESFSPAMFLDHIGRIKNGGLNPDDYAEQADKEDETDVKYRTWLPAIYEKYQSALRAANTLDFDDLLLLTLRLLKDHPECAAIFQDRYRYILVDEYQDTNRVQYGLLRILTKTHRNLCVVGDDDQSIYSWRGATIENILDFEKDFPEAKVIRLEQNYRSTESILNAANAVIERNRARRPKKLWSDMGKGVALDHLVVGDEDHEAHEVLGHMRGIAQEHNADFRDFAILYRSNLQSRPFEIALRQAGVPYAVYGGQEFYERSEIKDVVAYLRVLANPWDEPAFLRIVNVPRRGIGDTTLHRIHDLCRDEKISFGRAMAESLKRGMVSTRAEAGIRQALGLLQAYRARLRDRKEPLHAIVSDLIVHSGYQEEVVRTSKSATQAELRRSNLNAVVEAVSTYEASVKKPTLSGFLDASSLNNEADRKAEDRKPDNAVSLMTIHSAKGLEFPYVFVVGVEDGLMPHFKNTEGHGLEEERRLFYVALTRGMRHVVLSEALSRTRHGRDRLSKPSRFLKELPENLVQPHIRAARDMVAARVDPPKSKKKRPRRRAGT